LLDQTGLARSRDQLLSDISKVFSISSDSNTDQIAQLENILLSADLGNITIHIISAPFFHFLSWYRCCKYFFTL